MHGFVLTAALITSGVAAGQPPVPGSVFPPAEPVIVVEEPPPARFSFADRFWIHSSIVIGFSDRARLPDAYVAPAIGNAVRLPTDRSPSRARDGFALELGLWLDDARTHGIDAGYLELGDAFRRQDPTPVVTTIGTYPAAVTRQTSWWDTADVHYRRNVYDGDSLRIDGLIGYRYAGLTDTARVSRIQPDPFVGALVLRDRGAGENEFHGGQLGIALSYRVDRWTFGATGKVALGGVCQRATLTGDSMTALRGRALDTNWAGRFAVLPSVSYDLSWRFWRFNTLSVGYQFQYLSRAVRGTDALGALTDPNRDPRSTDSGFWAQGITLGIGCRF